MNRPTAPAARGEKVWGGAAGRGTGDDEASGVAVTGKARLLV